MEKDKKIELLAPAGNLEKMKTACVFGADAVYAGVPDFSLRTRINDFDLEKLAEAAEYCHDLGKKIYATVNVLAHNRHLEKLAAHILELKKIGVDALIVADPGVLMMAKKIWPDAEIHLSTQANCTNSESAKFWFEQGVKRVILGREVTLQEISEIHHAVPDLELEYFVHGAMCMAYSGRCFLSAELAGRSGNLGDCAQPCRWKYGNIQSPRNNNQKNSKFQIPNSKFIKAEGRDEEFEIVEEEHGSYILNSKDMCLLPYLKDLAEAGVKSFKIEGRAKSVYYQAVVCGAYSQAMEDLGLKKIINNNSNNDAAFPPPPLRKGTLDYLYAELENKLVHRGYTTGFLLGGRAEQNTLNSHNKCEWEFCGQTCNANTANFMQMPLIANNANRIIVKVHNSLKVGDEIEIVRPLYDIIKMKVGKMWDAKNSEELAEAHGGQRQMVWLEVPETAGQVPELSVLRRKLK